MAEDTTFKVGDSLWALTRKILARLNQGITTSGGGGGGGGGAVTVTDGGGGANATVSGGALKVDASGAAVPVTSAGLSNLDVALSTRLKPSDTLAGVTVVGSITNNVNVQGTYTNNATSPGTNNLAVVPAVANVAAPSWGENHMVVLSTDLAGSLRVVVPGSVAVTSAGLTNLDVALSTRLKPADTLAAVTTVGTITNPVAVTNAGLTNLDVALSTRLKPADTLAAVTTVTTVSTLTQGNVGGFSSLIKDTTAVSTSPAYTAGDAVGGKRTLTSALRTSNGTAILDSITVLDRANQSAPLTIFIFDANPTNATITDNAAFVFSTDDLKVVAQIQVGASDYVTTNSKAVACLKSLGVVIKGADSSTSLYAAVVTTGTPTFAATTDVQVTFGFLQD